MARILVVDDNPGARLFAGASLRQGGHDVEELAPVGLFEVLRSLHENPPDLMVTDLIMPGCPGMTLIRACREDPRLKPLRILLLTAYGDRKLARFLRAMGNIHYLAKPVAGLELAESVDCFLQGELEPDPGWALDCRGVVAVVDDSQLSRAFHMKCLRRAGYKPLEIVPDNLTSVLRTLEQELPKALLLDFLMPNFRGDALLRALRAAREPHLRDLPVLVITAHRPETMLRDVSFGQGVEVLYKPVLPEILAGKVEDLLGGRGES